MDRIAAPAKPKAGLTKRPAVYLDLAAFTLPSMALVLAASPLLRGLFFRPELLLMQSIVGALFALWTLDCLIKGRTGLTLHPMDIAVVVLCAAYFLSLTQAASMPNAVGAALAYLMYTLFYFMLSRSVTRLSSLRRWLGVLFWAGVLEAAVSLVASTGYLYYPGAYVGRAIYSTFQYKNAGAAYLLATGASGLVLQAERWTPANLSLYGLGNFLTTVVIFCSQSRGGWVLFPITYTALILLLPAGRRGRAFYAFLTNSGVALVVTRFLYPALAAGQGARALKLLAAGGVFLALVHVAAYALYRWLEQNTDPKVRKAFVAFALIYAVAVIAGYTLYAVEAFPKAGAAFLPSEVLARAESISGYEPSFRQRLQYYRDAVAIIKDHPLLGWGGGGWAAVYHRYQPYQYFTSEVHNHFLQVGVETGLLGLAAFLTIFAAMGAVVVRVWHSRPPEETDDNLWPLVWASAVAAYALAAHAVFDFDLSLPAIALTLWSLFALVRAGAGLATPERCTPAIAIKVSPGLYFLLGTALAALLCLPSYRFYQAGVTGAEAARTFSQGNLEKAHELYTAAHRLDPFTASYAADLAQVKTVLGLRETSEAELAAARELAQKAARAEPHNVAIRSTLSQVYLMQGFVKEAATEAEAVIEANPWDIGAYEGLGQFYLTAAGYLERYNMRREAYTYLEKAAKLPDEVTRRAERIRTAPGLAWQGPRFEVTPSLRLIQGKALYLSGHYQAAKAALAAVWAKPELRQVAAPWIAAAYSKVGEEREAQEILKKYPDARRDYESLREREG